MDTPMKIMFLVTTVVLISMVACQEWQTFNVSEDSAPHTPLGNISVGDTTNIGVSDPTKLSFSVSPSTYGANFYMSNWFGELRVSDDVIDREKACSNLKTCKVTLRINVHKDGSAQVISVIKVDVIVDDVNDNSPEFEGSEIRIEISEAAILKSNTTISLLAMDPDSPSFSVTRYELEPTLGPYFILQQEKANDGVVDNLRLMVNRELDRETQAQFTTSLVAYDGGNPPKTGTINLIVDITDWNDNPPKFPKEDYMVSIPENFGVGQSFFEVAATDEDEDVNAEILYAFSPLTKSAYGSVFVIDEETGKIKLADELDYEEIKQYVLTVEAKDNSQNPQIGSTKVTVQVTDVNDNAPAITVLPSGVVTLTEEQPVDTHVVHISVEDPDEDESGTFTCTMADDNFVLVQQQDSQTEFNLFTKVILDREVKSVYQPNLTCVDKGEPHKMSSRTIRVQILDINDNAPRFAGLQETFTVSIAENNAPGAPLTLRNISAYDTDFGENGTILYHLSEPSSTFSVNPHSGRITVLTSLDRETDTYLHKTDKDLILTRLVLNAVDEGNPPKTGSTIVEVHVIDMDDEKPEFSKSKFTLSVVEEQGPGALVGQVLAYDNDTSLFSIFSYSIVSGMDAASMFVIDASSGKINTTKTLDREVKSSYTFQVAATSVGSNPKSSQATVEVYVTDINDHTPEVTYPGTEAENSTLTITDKEPVDKVLAKIQAHDRDAGTNAKLSYFLDANVSGYFSVDENTGEISLKKSLKGVGERMFGLVVEVRDHGKPKHRSTKTLLKVMVEAVGDAMSNLTIVIIIGVVAGLFIILLIIAIAVLYRWQRIQEESKKYSHMASYLERQNQATTSIVSVDTDKTTPQVLPGSPPQFDDPTYQLPATIGYTNRGLDEKQDNKANNSLDQIDHVPSTSLPAHSQATGSDIHSNPPHRAAQYPSRSPPTADKDSDSGCSADISLTTESQRGSQGDPELQLVPLRPPSYSERGHYNRGQPSSHHHHHHHQHQQPDTVEPVLPPRASRPQSSSHPRHPPPPPPPSDTDPVYRQPRTHSDNTQQKPVHRHSNSNYDDNNRHSQSFNEQRWIRPPVRDHPYANHAHVQLNNSGRGGIDGGGGVRYEKHRASEV